MAKVRIMRRESSHVWSISYISTNVNLIMNKVKKMTEEGAVSDTYIAQRHASQSRVAMEMTGSS
jgi:hypothetical protein